MNDLNLAIVFYSMTGANVWMAGWAADAAKELGVNVKLMKVDELAPMSVINENPDWKETVEQTKNIPEARVDDLAWADVIIFSTPARFGSIPSQLKYFIDTTAESWSQGKLANKIVSAMATARNPHGGQEQAILQIYTAVYHWGAIVVPAGYTDFTGSGENPYGVCATVWDGGIVSPDDVRSAVRRQVERTIEIAKKIK